MNRSLMMRLGCFGPDEITALRAAFDTTCAVLQRHEKLDAVLRDEAAALILKFTTHKALDPETLATLAVTGLSVNYNILRSVDLASR